MPYTIHKVEIHPAPRAIITPWFCTKKKVSKPRRVTSKRKKHTRNMEREFQESVSSKCKPQEKGTKQWVQNLISW